MTNILTNYDLSRHNTMALSCMATQALVLGEADTFYDDVCFAMQFAKTHDLLMFVLSGGSNVILPNVLNALVLLPRLMGVDVISESDEDVCVQVACGENWHEFVQFCLKRGWYGLENLALIPGLVGASPIQNIGAYGVQVSDFIIRVLAVDLTTGEQVVFDRVECDFGYRHSFFKVNPNRYLITHVVFGLHKDGERVLTDYGDLASVSQAFAKQNGRATPHPVDVFDAVVQIRQSKLPDPSMLPNCGSFFQNPIISMVDFIKLKERFSDLPSYPIDDDFIKIPAGWLIDKAGLKGRGVFPILTHTKQALVLTNHAPYDATSQDIQASQDFIIKTVQEIFGVVLVREPVWVV